MAALLGCEGVTAAAYEGSGNYSQKRVTQSQTRKKITMPVYTYRHLEGRLRCRRWC